VAYAAKLDLPSLPWFKRAFPQSSFLLDRRALQLVALERQQAQQKTRALEERNRARKVAEQAEKDTALQLLRRQEQRQEVRARARVQAGVRGCVRFRWRVRVGQNGFLWVLMCGCGHVCKTPLQCTFARALPAAACFRRHLTP
jgi:hypothetical protein